MLFRQQRFNFDIKTLTLIGFTPSETVRLNANCLF